MIVVLQSKKECCISMSSLYFMSNELNFLWRQIVGFLLNISLFSPDNL